MFASEWNVACFCRPAVFRPRSTPTSAPLTLECDILMSTVSAYTLPRSTKKKHTKTPHYSKQTLTHHSCPRRDQSTLHTMTVKRTPDISYVREGRFEISGSGKVRKVNRFSYNSITIEIQFSQHKPLHLLLAIEGFRVHQPVP